MKIEVGKKYRTRGGNVVTIAAAPPSVAERPADIEAIDEIGATMLRLKHRMSGREIASVVAWFSARYD